MLFRHRVFLAEDGRVPGQAGGSRVTFSFLVFWLKLETGTPTEKVPNLLG